MVLKEGPTVTTFADVKEIRECRVSEANRLLEVGWELATVLPVATFIKENKAESIGAHVRRVIGYVMVRRFDGCPNDGQESEVGRNGDAG